MKTFNFKKEDLDYLCAAKYRVDSKKLDIQMINLGIEAYILGMVLPKLGVGSEEKVHVKYYLDKGTLEVYAQDEKQPDYQLSAEAQPETPAEAAPENKPEETAG